MTGSEYYQEILETIDEQEVDQMIEQCSSIAVSHNCSPYQVMIDLLHFKWSQANQDYWESKNQSDELKFPSNNFSLED